MHWLRATLVAAAMLAAALVLTACGRQPTDHVPTPAPQQQPEDMGTAAWPRSFHNADGSTTPIPARPTRILSTSPTLTGTLLAIDAPVVASATLVDGSFLGQWAALAQARGVEKLWPAGRMDLEAVLAVAPDLIVVSTGGADSTLAHVQQLRSVAPTIVLDYGGEPWQSLARQLGQATGHEAQAQARITAFDAYVAQARQQLQLPAGQANIVSYNGPAISNPVATPEGPHGRLLSALGFRMEAPDPAWHSSAESARNFVWAPYEKLPSLRAETTFLLRGDDSRAAAFLADPVLANLPSVRNGQVYGLGVHSFRIDYFSATEIVDGMVERFGR
ncbi:Fe2+-enterobactin ABC transporter substrate-binding protein [Corticibacter populi]|uniref:Fe2+-enterobactin ABC transporter substrate-binding protein n=2 Tax=Corticibacter populi TaxID=1550736 RepID=A0A3M6R0Y6_9BURK|nr:Fe2+-enterobactin ABC transporter substrate-binding protein [Corticibacter populi]